MISYIGLEDYFYLVNSAGLDEMLHIAMCSISSGSSLSAKVTLWQISKYINNQDLS